MVAPVSLTLTILPSRPGQTRSAGTAGMSLCQSALRRSGRRLRCLAWYPQIMAPTLARRRTSTATRGRSMYSWSTVRARSRRPGGGAQGGGGASEEVSARPGRQGVLGMGELGWMVQGLQGCLRGLLQRVILWGPQPPEFREFCDQTDRLGSDWALRHPIARYSAP